jgi:comEA protein
MSSGRNNHYWTLVIVLLIAVTALGIAAVRSRLDNAGMIEIMLPEPPATTTSVNYSSPAQQVNINTAENWLLQALPGIGPTLAQRIIDYRTQNGPFPSTRELANVKGIGLDLYEKLKNLITVGG